MIENFFKETRSIAYLQKRCRDVLREYLDLDPEFVFSKNFSWRKTESKVRDIVLMGDALLLLTDKYLWPTNKSYRFWVLSESHKNLISKIFYLDPKHLSVIPRHLIAQKYRTLPWPDFHEVTTFVISSRLIEDKNIQLTLHFANALQQIYPKMSIAVFSPSEAIDFRNKSIKSFSWKKKPKVYGDKGFNWHKSQKLIRPFLVNLSTYPMEDFNVSISQGRELGWPLILSNWAVFREIDGPVVRLNCEKIFTYNESKSTANKDSIVSTILEDFEKQICLSGKMDSKLQRLSKPRAISAKALAKLQDRWSPRERQLLISAFLEPRERKKNPYYQKIRRLFS